MRARPTAWRLVPGRRRWGRCSRSVPVLLALCALAVSMAACGVPYDTSPQSAPEVLPSQLTRTYLSTPQTTLSLPQNATRASFYYVDHSELIADGQEIASPVELPEVLQILERGPQNTVNDGRVIGTIISRSSHLVAKGISKSGVAYVVLDQTYYQLPSTEEQILELAQIVYTLQADLPQVREVSFYKGTAPAAIFNGNGELVVSPVDEQTYCNWTTTGCPQARNSHQAP